MGKALRRKVIAGNWKMNMTPSQACEFIEKLKPMTAGLDGADIVVCVPDVDIAVIAEKIAGTNIKLGAQNAHWAEKGAFTGETSTAMLKEMGVEYVINGHSERRQYFGEVNDTVNSRVLAVLGAGLKTILCVGELLSEREQGVTDEIISIQVKCALRNVTEEQMERVIIAYEPVWAIGTGKTATAEDADAVTGMIRSLLAKLYSPETAEKALIQYGGSMNAKNAAELLAKPNVDGGLIGGASLVAEDFTAIIKAAQ